jgi:hypothetical protein
MNSEKLFELAVLFSHGVSLSHGGAESLLQAENLTF